MSKSIKSSLNYIFKDQPKIFKYWLTFSLVFGFSLVFIIPPFQSPDEINHFYRIYQITDGKLVGEFNDSVNHLGGKIPESLIEVTTPFDWPLAYNLEGRVSIDTVQKYLKYPLNKTKTTFRAFPNTARYAPIAYTPQVLAFSVFKIFNMPPLQMMYWGRLFTFLTWLLIVALAVLITPVFKELFMMFLLLPASMSINSTLNADIFTNALAFLAFALFFRFRQKLRIKKSELALFSVLIFVITINKIVYFPICLLLVFVPTENFKSMQQKLGLIFFNLLLCIVTILIWSNVVNHLIYPDPNNINLITYEGMRPGVEINPTKQIQLIEKKPFSFLGNLVKQSALIFTDRTPSSWIASFGVDGYIPSGLGLSLFYLMAIWSSIYNYNFKELERFGLIVLAFGMMVLFILSQHLHWDGVGDYFESSYLGKYYIPIFPLYFWAISGIFSSLKFNLKKLKILNALLITVFAIVYIDFWILIYQRYYS